MVLGVVKFLYSFIRSIKSLTSLFMLRSVFAHPVFLYHHYTDDMLATTPVMPLPSDGVCGVDEEREFVWDDYREDTKSTAAPATSFKHVSTQ